MAYDFRLPDLGEGIHEGELRKWLVKEGEQVEEHQPIAEVETDKAVVEVPSPKTGKVLKLHFKPGDIMRVGDVIMTVGDVSEVLAKAAAPLTAPQAMPRRIAKGATGAVGELEEAPEEEEKAVPKPSAPLSKVTVVAALPAVRKLAAQLGVDLVQVHGTGAGGRITEADVRNASGKVPPAAAIERKQPRVAFEQYGRVLRIPLRGLRKTISENMVRAFQTTVPVTHMDEADVTELAKIREAKKKMAEDKGYPLTYLPFVAKAAVIALKEHPYLNSSLDDASGEIVVKQYYNVGFAVDTTEGLIVPVVKGCEQKSILEIAKDLYARAEEARNREIKLEDLRGGTFTITNIGTLGGEHATPIINWPECAILALGRLQDKPVVRNGKVVVRKILPLSLTFDHRIVDGAEAARFINDLIKHLEDPSLMLLEAF